MKSFSQNFIYHFLVLCLLICLTLQSKSSSSILNDQKGSKDFFLKNLFVSQKEMIIQTQIIGKQRKILASRNTSLILENEYLQMYKNRFNFKLPLNLNKDIIQNLEFLKLKVNLYVVINETPKFLCSQQINMIAHFKKIFRQGIELFLSNDFSDPNQYDLAYIIKLFDIYLFETSIEIQEQDFQLQFYRKYNSSHFIVKPFIKDVNQVDIDQYRLVSQLQQEETHMVNVNIKLKSQFTLLIMGLFYNSDKLSNNSDYEELSKIFHGDYIKQFKDKVTLFMKKLWLDGSSLGILFFYSKIVFFLFVVSISPFAYFIYQIKLFRNISKYHGISMFSYAFRLYFYGIIILFALFYSGSSQSVKEFSKGAFITVIYYNWAVSKALKIKFVNQFPFISFRKQPWYQRYSHLQLRVIKIVCMSLGLLFLIFVSCPILINGQKFQGSLILDRTIQFFTTYQTFIMLFSQILMNYQLKSTQGVSWKLMFWCMCYSLNDMFTWQVVQNYLSVLFYVKEEILILILYYQKSLYKDNVCELLLDEQPNQDNNNDNIRSQINSQKRQNQIESKTLNVGSQSIQVQTQQHEIQKKQVDFQTSLLKQDSQRVSLQKQSEINQNHQKTQ